MLTAKIDFFFSMDGMMWAVLTDVHTADRIFQDAILGSLIRMMCLIMMMRVILIHILFSFYGNVSSTSDRPDMEFRMLLVSNADIAVFCIECPGIGRLITTGC